MFGGIQDVTKQKNDIYIYQSDKNKWYKIHTTTNSIYDCSPTLKKDSKVRIYLLRKTKVLKLYHQLEYHHKNLIEMITQ